MNPNDKLTQKETADLLGVTVSALYGLVRRGLLVKHTNLVGQGMGGRRVFFLRADVDALRNAEAPAPAPVAPISQRGKPSKTKLKGAK